MTVWSGDVLPAFVGQLDRLSIRVDDLGHRSSAFQPAFAPAAALREARRRVAHLQGISVSHGRLSVAQCA
jgi:hypothetical protein